MKFKSSQYRFWEAALEAATKSRKTTKNTQLCFCMGEDSEAKWLQTTRQEDPQSVGPLSSPAFTVARTRENMD